MRGRLPYWIKYLHDRFDSDVVRIAPNELSFINPSAWKNIHGTRPGHLSFEKNPAVYAMPPNGTPSLVTANRMDHTRMRRVLGHAFSDKAIREQEPTIESYVNLFIERLRAQSEGKVGRVDISMWLRWLAFDIAGDLSFGESFGCLRNQQLHSWANMIPSFLEADICEAAYSRFPGFSYVLPYLISEKTKLMARDHFAASSEKLTRRLKLGAQRSDFITPIIKHNEEGKGLTPGELRSNASVFIVAGSDTSATVLTGTIYYLLQNPPVMEKVTSEVRRAFETEAEIDPQRVGHLPYMLACIEETHRIYPTILTGEAVVVPPGGDTVGEDWMPGGVSLLSGWSWSTYSLRLSN